MTKNVDQAHIDMYLDILNLRFDMGRADIAQNLRSMGEMAIRPVTRAKPANVHALVRSAALGCQTVGGVDPPSGRSKQKHHVSVGELNRLHFESCRMPRTEKKKAEDRHVDSWSREGKDGRWTGIHRSGRRALLTPSKVAGGRNAKTPLKKIRITRG